MKVIVSILICGLCLGARAEIEQATVTLPYSELLDLLEQVKSADEDLEEEPLKPPVDVIVQSANYAIDCRDPEAPTLEAAFSVMNLSEAWQSVFLLEASEAIRSLDPPDAKLVQIDGGMHLLLEPKASATVKVGLQAESAGRTQGGQLIADFYAVGAAQSSLKLTHASDPSAVVVLGAVGSNREKTEFSLPALGGAVQVRLYPAEAVQPTVWRAAATYWMQDLGGMMQVSSHLRLGATDGGLTSRAKLMLESTASRIEIADVGPGAAARDAIEMTSDGPVVHLEWPHDGAMAREVMVKYQVPIEMTEGNFSVPLLRVGDAVRTDVACYVSQFEGMEVKPSGESWSAVGRLPDWIGGHERVENLMHVRPPDEKSLKLTARILPRVKTASATVHSANYSTELVAEGGMLHRADLSIQHGDAAEYVFNLPEGGKLLSASLNGRAIEPLLLEDGGMKLHLPKGSPEQSQTRVGYVFTTKGVKMNPVDGKAALELPRTPMFIHKLFWEVHLPAEYQATAMEGNLVIDAGGAGGGAVRLSKQIVDQEAPFAALYYTRKDLN